MKSRGIEFPEENVFTNFNEILLLLRHEVQREPFWLASVGCRWLQNWDGVFIADDAFQL